MASSSSSPSPQRTRSQTRRADHLFAYSHTRCTPWHLGVLDLTFTCRRARSRTHAFEYLYTCLSRKQFKRYTLFRTLSHTHMQALNMRQWPRTRESRRQRQATHPERAINERVRVRRRPDTFRAISAPVLAAHVRDHEHNLTIFARRAQRAKNYDR